LRKRKQKGKRKKKKRKTITDSTAPEGASHHTKTTFVSRLWREEGRWGRKGAGGRGRKGGGER
jgi:hypothetical protein